MGYLTFQESDVNKNVRIGMLYALSRVHLIERHVDILANTIKMKFPEEAEQIDDLRSEWLKECEMMHDAFLRGDFSYFEQYEKTVEGRRKRWR